MKKIVYYFNFVLVVCLVATTNLFAQEQGDLSVSMQSDKVDVYGRMSAPNGSEWTYTMNLVRSGSFFNSFVLSVYNEQNELVGEVSDNVPTENVTGINDIDVVPLVTKKFFNVDENYEVMLFMHGTTKDYSGRFLNVVYSLAETAQKLTTIEGRIATWINAGTEEEKFTLVFQKNFKAGVDTYLKYDVYSAATADSGSAILAHTFSVNAYNTVYAYGIIGASSPIILVANDGEVNYLTSEFDKMFMESNINNLVITRYDSSFAKVSTTKVAPIANASFDYSIPIFGLLDSNSDVAFDYGENSDAFVVAMGHTTEAELWSSIVSYSFYLIDKEGNVLKTLATDVTSFNRMPDVEGHSRQWAFVSKDKATLVDFTTFEAVAELPFEINGKALLPSFVRCAVGDTYQYVAALEEEEILAGGEVIQCVAWFDKDANLLRYDTLNVGKDIDVSYVHISAELLNPKIFNSDDAYEYIVTAFRGADEVILVCNNKGEILYEFTEDIDKGGKIAANYMIFGEDKAFFVLVYSDNNSKYTLNYYELILEDNSGNTGTALDNVETAIVFDGAELVASGDICVFGANGQLVLQGVDCVSVDRLPAGVYVVKTATVATKIMLK